MADLERSEDNTALRFKRGRAVALTYNYWQTVWQDLCYGARVLRRNLTFTVVTIVTLALGISTNIAICTLTYEVLLSRLPVRHPEELVILRSPGPSRGHTHSDSQMEGTAFSYPAYQALRSETPVFSGLLARLATSLSISGNGIPEIVNGELVSGNYFQVLGVGPALGRVLLPQDETAPGANPVAILSYGYWNRRYAKSPGIVNQQITVNGTLITIVGVAAEEFTGVQAGENPDIFIPVTMKAQMTPNWDGLADQTDRWLALIGRVKPGLTRETAESVLQPFYLAILESELPLMKYSEKAQHAFLSRRLFLDPGSHGRPILKERVGQPLIFLAAMMALILLITCANLASLLIVNGESRQSEIALRLSLGAGRFRIVRQLLTESLLLALGGGLVGLGIAFGILRSLSVPIAENVGDLHFGSELDLHMLAIGSAFSVLTWILFGLAPSLRVTGTILRVSLLRQSMKTIGSKSNVRLRKWLMVTQMAMTVLLIAESSLFMQTLLNLRHSDLGMSSDHVIQFSVSPGLDHYTPLHALNLIEQMRKTLLALPGAQGVGVAEVPLFADSDRGGNITIEGYVAKENEDMNVYMNLVGPTYFRAMGIPILAGREFGESDDSTGPRVAVINQSMVHRYFSGRDPIGRRFTFGTGHVQPDIRIVGVVRDSKHSSARDESVPFVFLPYAQDPKLAEVFVYVRTAQDPVSMIATIRKTVANLDANLPLAGLKTLEQQLDISMFAERATAYLTLGLGALAALLAAVGLYGVMAYLVVKRTREIGVRIALGATRQRLAWLILREVINMALVGLCVGIVLSVVAAHLTHSLLFGVASRDPVTIVLTVSVLASIALFTGGLSAYKASRVNPMIALRYE